MEATKKYKKSRDEYSYFESTFNDSRHLHDLRTYASNQKKYNTYLNRQTDWKPRVLKHLQNTNVNICLPLFNTFQSSTTKSIHHG
jgi:hypothetical protein